MTDELDVVARARSTSLTVGITIDFKKTFRVHSWISRRVTIVLFTIFGSCGYFTPRHGPTIRCLTV